MTLKFSKLTRPNIRNLESGQIVNEHGITFQRLPDGDGKYTINIMVDGQRVHRVIGRESEGVTRNDAEDFIGQARTNAREGRLNLPKGRKVVLGFREASKAYLEGLVKEGGKDIVFKTMRLNTHLVPFFQDTPLDKITGFDIERYKKCRQEEGSVNGTINRELAALSHLFTKAEEWRWITHRPARIKRLKEGQGRITYLTVEQVKRVIQAAKEDQCEYIYPFCVIALETSMRKGEVLSIRLGNINLDQRVIYIPKAKAGAREQPITASLVDFLKGYIETAEPDQEWLFPSPSSKSGHAEWIVEPFRRVVKAAGLDPKDIVPHTLRHTAISHLVQAGIDLPTVQRISGHKTLQMVVRYAHQNGEHIREAMDTLESRYKLA